MAKALKAIKILAGSFSLCLLLCFVAFEVFLEYCPSQQLQFLGPNQLKDRPPVLTKLGSYEKDHMQRPTVLLVGSSLAQFAANCCDFAVFGSPDLNKNYALYSKFRYLDKLLANQHDRAASMGLETANLSNSGTMISEDFLIIKEAMGKKNPPRAVVLEIGPRDFIDNMAPDVGRSRLAQVLSRHQEPFKWRADRSVSENMDLAADKLSLFYSIRGELHDCLIKLLCDQTHHPASIYQATLLAKLAPPPDLMGEAAIPANNNSAAAGAGSNAANANSKSNSTSNPNSNSNSNQASDLKPGFLADCVGSEALQRFSEKEYRGRYLPLNTKRWPLETANLKEIVQYCRGKNLPLLVVNMPLTQRNLQILPPAFLNEYEKTVAEICRPLPSDNNIAYLNLRNDKRFTVSDFRDIAHMRSSGGKKLADLIAPVLAEKISGENGEKGSLRFASKAGSPN